MTNRKKFKEVFNRDIYWSGTLEPETLAPKGAHIDGIDHMEEWLNAEYKEPIFNKIKAEIIAESFPKDKETSCCTVVYLHDVLAILDKYKTESEERK